MTERLVDLLVEEDAWLTALPDLENTAEQAARMALDAADLDASDYAISLLACGDPRIADLNAGHRGKPTPTNVLSWPSFELAAETPGSLPTRPRPGPIPGPIALGDVAIALQTCVREAKDAAKPLKFHVTHLILHGSLHLLGYDHETPADAALMEGIESQALLAAGFSDPYV